jgi:SpoVK/Ycf46/Vps4 family AAA+-type ATPase
VLPEPQTRTLREIVVHVRHRARVYEEWGFAGRGSRGLGISALFAGPSGTGKTLAAEVMAAELGLDLYRIDLSQVVNKYIGETEKNLRRVFDAAEEGGAVLLFDEADALFGKRSEVKDSHDRYANIEVSYLLQRMEAYRGLAILTTNLKSSLDTAFLRRLRFVVSFPFPDAAQRARIWDRAFPAGTPTAGLDAEKLARLNVAGGNIRNIALGAAFLAAADGGPVRMEHLLQAARGELAKLEKPVSPAEVAGWA